MVFMPVRAVTVAEPPKDNMEDTTMFVAKPKKRKIKWAVLPHLRNTSVQIHCDIKGNAPLADDFEECMGIRGIQLELGSELCKEKDLDCSTAAIPPGPTTTDKYE
jgi:hypothetical protein